eukprot:SAG11_NODE_7203_length_1178_cov_1.544949_1_plen_43_part_10
MICYSRFRPQMIMCYNVLQCATMCYNVLQSYSYWYLGTWYLGT